MMCCPCGRDELCGLQGDPADHKAEERHNGSVFNDILNEKE